MTFARRGIAAAWLLAAHFAPAGALYGQDAAGLRDACSAAGGVVQRCADAALAARALLAHGGGAAGLGSEVPGSPSTLGSRIGRTPRVALSFRGGLLGASLPDLRAPLGGVVPEASFTLSLVEGGVGVGVLDGFNPLPTVGGVLSLDLVGRATYLFLPTGDGFEGGAPAISLGARLGLLRESFTLPGVSASASYRTSGGIRFGSVSGGNPSQVSVDPAVVSFRGTIGKDLVGVGLLGGVGWDAYSAETTLVVPDGSGGSAAATSSLEVGRALYFVGASMSFLVLQLSAEGGWANGFPALEGSTRAGFDPQAGSPFATVAARLTL